MGSKKIFTKTGATTVNVSIAVAILGVLILFGFGIGAAIFGIVPWGENSPKFGSGVSGTGCSLKNEAFSDITTITSADQVINTLKERYPSIGGVKDKIQDIISASSNAGINPAVLISFWYGEQTFRSDYKAFGCGHYSVGGDDSGWEKQKSCAISLIKKAMDSEGVYSTPSGENTWTRLLYHYVAAARKDSFDQRGYVSDSKEARIQLLSDLVPDQVQCDTGFASKATGDPIGPYDTSFMNQANLKNWLSKRKGADYNINSHGVTLHWTGKSVPADKPLGKEGVKKDIIDYWMGLSPPNVTHLLIDSDGTVYQFVPFNIKQSGSGTATVGNTKKSANNFTIGIEIAGVGDELMKNEKQKAVVVQVINNLINGGHSTREIGNATNFSAQRGIFGHYQTGGGEGTPGCSSSRKDDPGKTYMEYIWSQVNATGNKCS